MSEHEHPLAREVVSLTIGRFQADGTAVIRRWHLHACCAEALAADSGTPAAEVIVTGEAGVSLREHVTALRRGHRPAG